MSHEPKNAQGLFLEAVENVPCDEWDSFLDDACGNDPALRHQVQRLLDAHRQDDSFMEMPAARRPPVAEVTEKPGDTIGPYKLLEQIGEGGMGVVYMAEQTEPVARRVALKIIKPGMDTRQVIARFEAERQALALMDHPNIAKVLDAGTTGEPEGVSPRRQSSPLAPAGTPATTDSPLSSVGRGAGGEGTGNQSASASSLQPSALATGRPYFVMELVKGLPITQYCDEQHLTPRERLELFLPVCQAVQHAHQKGVIHRDLKPSNILVARYDDHAVPKIIDFGVAKAVSQRLTEKTMFTQYGQIVGTIEYMSPEQAQFNQLDVDTRSDIYSLGVILYELLTGETPFEKQRLRAAAFDELLRIIREEEPPKPSTRLSGSKTLPAIASSRRTEPKKLSALLRGELDWIVMKALEKDRARRYETASAFAADVQHHLNDEPVLACPPSMLYRLGKFARRHRPALTTAVGVALALVAAVAILIGSNIRERRNREELAVALKHEKKTVYFHRIALAYRELDHGRRAREYLDDCPLELRHWEWYHLNWLLNRSVRTFQGHTHRVVAVAWRPDGSRIASAGWDGTIREWDPDTGEVLGILPARKDEDDEVEWVTAVDYSPDGRRIAAATWKKVRIWNTHDRAVDLEIPVCQEDEYVLAVAFSPDGKRVASAGSDNHAVQVWDAVTGEPVLPLLEGHTDLVSSLAFSPDGRWIASGSEDKTIRLWDALTGEPVRTIEGYDPVGNPQGHELGVSAVTFSRDSRLLASGSWDTTVQVWDVETGAHRLTIRGHSHWVSDVAFSLDGQRLFSVSADTTGRMWDARNGKQLLILRGHLAPVYALALSPDGSRLVTGSWDKTLKLWDATARDEVLTLRGHEGTVYSVAFSPDGKWVVSGSDDTTVRLWNLLTEREEMKLTGHTGDVTSVDVSSDGRWIASASLDGTARLWDLQTGIETARLTHPAAVHAVSFSPDGTWLATACDDRMARIWNVESGAEQRILSGHSDAVVSISWSGDGALLATGSNDGTVRLWDAGDGRTLKLFRGHSGPVNSVAIAPDCKQMVSTSAFSNDLTVGEVRFWDVETAEPFPMPLQPRQGPQASVAYSPDGRRVVSAGANGALTLWDTETREQAIVLRAHQVEVSWAVFSSDGRRIVSGGYDRTIEVRETLGMDASAGASATPLDAAVTTERSLDTQKVQ